MQHRSERYGAIGVLQAGRALASTAVLVHHAALSTKAFVADVPSWVGKVAEQSISFNFFFVLSGFIILYVHGRDSKTAESALSFIYKRITRIFAPYLPIAIGLMLAYALLPELSKANRTWGVFSTLTLLPTEKRTALSVAWTLQHELIFYGLFVSFYFVRRSALVIGLWGAAISIGWVSGAWAMSRFPFLIVAFHPLNLMFIAGMAAGVVVGRIDDRLWPAPLAIGLLAAIGFLLTRDSLGARVGFGVAMAPIIMAFIMLERDGKIRVPNRLATFGGASYAIYLIHNPLISLVSRITGSVNCWFGTMAAGVIASVVAGLAYHLLVERRMGAYFKARVPTLAAPWLRLHQA
jgi:peptidoglycan/LPS O-acetylase OafA/YrhL